MVEDFENPEKAKFVRWRSNGQLIEKLYQTPVAAVVLASGTGVAVAETGDRPDNGVIYNEDGSLRVRLVNPYPHHGETVFGDVYYECDELKFTIRSRDINRAAVYDEQGNLIREHEAW